MNNLGSPIPDNRTSPRRRNTFFDYHVPPPSSSSTPSLPPPPAAEEKSHQKRRSIFTLSGSLPTKPSPNSRKKSQELLNIVTEVQAMNISPGNNTSSNNTNNNKSTSSISVNGRSQNSDDQAKESGYYRLLQAEKNSNNLNTGVPGSPPSRSLPSSILEDSFILTPPPTPDPKQPLEDSPGAGGKTRQRHGSLENLHRPKNHRSVTNPNSMKKRRANKDSDGDNSSTSGSARSRKASSSSRIARSCGKLPANSSSASSKDSRKVLKSRAATAFALGAVRKLSTQVTKLEEENEVKKRESAARMILHTMLLNTWRQCVKQNEKFVKDNCMHLRTIENMCLQLRVIRQMHREEKDKSQTRSVQVSSLAIQISDLKAERDKIQSELENVENELNQCQLYVESLNNTNEDLQKSNNKLQKSIALLEKEKQEEMKKVSRLEMDQIRLQDMITELKQQFQEETRQRVRWQEDARGKDSEIFSLKSEIETKDKQINKLRNSYQEIQEEVDHHQNAKLKLQKEKLKLREQLESAHGEVRLLNQKLVKSEEEVEHQTQRCGDIQIAVTQHEQVIKEIRSNIYMYASEGIARRRKWANAFHYLVFPFDVVRVILDLPKESSYAVDLGKINAECKLRDES